MLFVLRIVFCHFAGVLVSSASALRAGFDCDHDRKSWNEENKSCALEGNKHTTTSFASGGGESPESHNTEQEHDHVDISGAAGIGVVLSQQDNDVVRTSRRSFPLKSCHAAEIITSIVKKEDAENTKCCESASSGSASVGPMINYHEEKGEDVWSDKAMQKHEDEKHGSGESTRQPAFRMLKNNSRAGSEEAGSSTVANDHAANGQDEAIITIVRNNEPEAVDKKLTSDQQQQPMARELKKDPILTPSSIPKNECKEPQIKYMTCKRPAGFKI